MSAIRIDNEIHITTPRIYYDALTDIHWNQKKYGDDPRGTSIKVKYCNNPDIEYYIFVFTEDTLHLKTTRQKVMEYIHDTPQAATVKFDKKVIVVPLSIFKTVPDDVEYDVDTQQFQ